MPRLKKWEQRRIDILNNPALHPQLREYLGYVDDTISWPTTTTSTSSTSTSTTTTSSSTTTTTV